MTCTSRVSICNLVLSSVCNLISEFLILFAAVVAGEETEVLVGIKNDGNALSPHVVCVSVFCLIFWNCNVVVGCWIYSLRMLLGHLLFFFFLLDAACSNVNLILNLVYFNIMQGNQLLMSLPYRLVFISLMNIATCSRIFLPRYLFIPLPDILCF